MKWARPEAHAMLQLHAVRINDDRDDFQRFHRHREHIRLYGACSSPGHSDAHALALAA